MSTGAPERLDPFKAAKQHMTLDGNIEISDLLRAKKGISGKGSVTYKLDFYFDSDQLCVIAGELEAEYEVVCHRCLGTFVDSTKCSFTISPVTDDEQAKALPKDYDPISLTEGKLEVTDLIEDELILAMPIVPMHIEGAKECAEVASEEVKETHKPFQVLEKLNVKKESQETGDK